MTVKHAHNPAGDGEFTMCGLAFDAHRTGDHDEDIAFVGAGEAVTCQECRRVVLEVRKIKLGRMPSNARVKAAAEGSPATERSEP